MKLTLPLPPSTNELWRSFRGRTVKSEVARKFVAMAQLQAKTQGARMMQGHLRADCVFYLPSWRSDADNRIKPLLDALQGVAYENDRQVKAGSWLALVDPERPRAVVSIEVIEQAIPAPMRAPRKAAAR